MAVKLNEKYVETINAFMQNPSSTDEELAKVLKISRSAVAKRRNEMVAKGYLRFFAAPDIGKMYGNTMAGIFKFQPSVSYVQAEKVAKKIAKEDYVWDVYIRKSSSDSWGVGILCVSQQLSTREGYDEVFERLKNIVVKEVKADLRGWDVASGVHYLKMLGQKMEPQFVPAGVKRTERKWKE